MCKLVVYLQSITKNVAGNLKSLYRIFLALNKSKAMKLEDILPKMYTSVFVYIFNDVTLNILYDVLGNQPV